MKGSDNQFPKLTIAEHAAPGTPGDGLFYVYVKTDGKFYTKNDAGTEVCLSDGLTNPMNAAGDVIYGGASGTPTRLGKGTALQVFRMKSDATIPEWAAPGGGVLALLSSWAHSINVTTIDIAMPASWESTYQGVLVMMNIRTDRGSQALEGIRMRLSTGGTYDTGTNYWNRSVETGDTATTQSSATEDSIWIGRFSFPGATADANVFGYGELRLLGANMSGPFTSVRGHSLTLSTAATYRHNEVYGMWKNGGVVDGLRFYTANTTNMLTGSWIKIYGIKAA